MSTGTGEQENSEEYKSRLKGSAVGRTASLAVSQSAEIVTPRIKFKEGPLEIEAGEVREFESGAKGLIDAEVGGMWHLSRHMIAEFDKTKGSTVGALGPGTYVGGGKFSSDAVEILRRGDHRKHVVKYRGNLLVVPFDQAFDAQYEIGEAIGKLPESIKPISLAKLLSENQVDGVQYQGLILFGGEVGEEIAHGVIFPDFADQLSIGGRTIVSQASYKGAE